MPVTETRPYDPLRAAVYALAALLFFLSAAHASPEDGRAPAGPSAESIVARLMEANRTRAARIRRYTATRTYHAVNYKSKKSAEMRVRVNFESPDAKRFEVLSEQGSHIIRKRVFDSLMAAEIEAAHPGIKHRSAIHTDNYRFERIGEEVLAGRRSYVLQAEPRRTDRYLWRGRLWIDAEDFAVAKIKGQPAKSPSFWTRKVEIERDYLKMGDFWLPARDASQSDIRIFGKSSVLIEYFDYQLETSESKSP